MWDQSSGSQFGQIIQSLMQQNPQVYQRLMQLMSQQRTAGIGSLQPRQGGDLRGPMPMDRAPYSGGQPPQGGMWGMPRAALPQPMPTGGGYNTQAGGLRPGGTTLDSYPRMGGGDGYAWGPNAAGQRALMPAPTYGNSGFQGTGPTLPYAQRFNTSPQPYIPPMPMRTADRPAAPYRAPAYTPAPFSAPAAQPKTYGAPAPAGPSLAQNGTSGLDWYAQQAGS